MATNMDIPDSNGGSQRVPQWASEDTLSSVLAELLRNNAVDQRIQNAVQSAGLDASVLENALGKLGASLEDLGEQQTSKSKKIGEAIDKTVSKLGQDISKTDKPLTATLGAIETVAGGVGDAVGLLKDNTAAVGTVTDGVASAGSKWKQVFEVGGALAMAVAGFNAAKLEDFAASSKTLMDAGTIFTNTAEGSLSSLYHTVTEKGGKFSTLATLVSNHGEAMRMLGGDVATGTKEFVNMLYGSASGMGIIELSRKFNSFGLGLDELQEEYADFIEIRANAGLLAQEEDRTTEALFSAFSSYMMETQALATLTGWKASEIRKSKKALADDTIFSAAIYSMTEKDLANATDVTESATLLAGLTPGLGQMGDMIMQAKNDAAVIYDSTNGDVEAANARFVTSFRSQMAGSEISPLLSLIQDDQLVSLSQLFYDGAETTTAELAEKLRNLVPKDELEKIQSRLMNTADNKELGAQIATAKLFLKSTEKLSELDALAARLASEGGYDGAQASQALNNAEQALIKAQEAVTFDMDTLADTAELLTGGFKAATGGLQDIIAGLTGENPYPDEPFYQDNTPGYNSDESPVPNVAWQNYLPPNLSDVYGVQSTPTPVVSDNKPVVSDNNPVVSDNKPVVLDNNPVVLDNKPVVLDNNPVVLDNKPVVLDNKPVVLDNKSSDNIPNRRTAKPSPPYKKPEEQPQNPYADIFDPIVSNAITAISKYKQTGDTTSMSASEIDGITSHISDIRREVDSELRKFNSTNKLDTLTDMVNTLVNSGVMTKDDLVGALSKISVKSVNGTNDKLSSSALDNLEKFIDHSLDNSENKTYQGTMSGLDKIDDVFFNSIMSGMRDIETNIKTPSTTVDPVSDTSDLTESNRQAALDATLQLQQTMLESVNRFEKVIQDWEKQSSPYNAHA